MFYYEDPAAVIALGAILPAIDVVVVALRFYARRKQKLQLMVDDWLVVPALVSCVSPIEFDPYVTCARS